MHSGCASPLVQSGERRPKACLPPRKSKNTNGGGGTQPCRIIIQAPHSLCTSFRSHNNIDTLNLLFLTKRINYERFYPLHTEIPTFYFDFFSPSSFLNSWTGAESNRLYRLGPLSQGCTLIWDVSIVRSSFFRGVLSQNRDLIPPNVKACRYTVGWGGEQWRRGT